jgi:hypothetical protein
MHPLLASALGAVIRWALTLLVPFFVANGIWTPDESVAYVTGATIAILSLIWSLWQKYGARVEFLNALWSMPATPEKDVKNLPAPPLKELLK